MNAIYLLFCQPLLVLSSPQNELILVAVLETIYEAISALLRGSVDKRTMLDNLELILLAIDETLDHGHIMELDSASIVGRVLMRGNGTGSGGGLDGGSSHSSASSNANASSHSTPVGDLSIAQALGLARDQFFKTLAGGSRSDGY